MSDQARENESPATACPARTRRPRTNQDWWPNQPDLRALRQHAPRPNPVGRNFSYAKE